MVVVFVGQQRRLDLLGIKTESPQPATGLLSGKTDIHDNRPVSAGEDQRIAFAAAAQRTQSDHFFKKLLKTPNFRPESKNQQNKTETTGKKLF